MEMNVEGVVVVVERGVRRWDDETAYRHHSPRFWDASQAIFLAGATGQRLFSLVAYSLISLREGTFSSI